MVWAVLLVAICLIAHQIWQDRQHFPAFEQLSGSEARQRTFRRWIVDSFIRYGLLGLLGLYLIGDLDAVYRLPSDIEAARTSLGLPPGRAQWMGYGLAAAVTIGLVAGAAGSASLDPSKVSQDGVGSLFARNRQEARWTGLLSLNAGLTEEIFFRALLFTALFEATGSLIVAALLATVLFAVAHLYQGLNGVLSSGLFGVIFMMIYLMTGALWLVILLHALIDLRSLVLLPYSLGWLSPEKDTSS